MKKLLIVFALAMFSWETFAQGFVNPANRWNVKSEINFGAVNTEIIKISGDSMVADKAYKKLLLSHDSTMNNWQITGLLREESNKVYYLANYWNSEGLLYDFNIQAGDTTHIVNFWSPDSQELICKTIDSISYNGLYHKRWTFEFPGEEWLGAEVWLEGIGSTRGLIYGGQMPADLYFTLLCFHQDETLYYMDPDATRCFYTNVGIEEPGKQSDVTLSPNPLPKGQLLEIKSKNLIDHIAVYNMSGIENRKFTGIESKSTNIDLSYLPSGIYLIRLTTTNDITYSRKIRIK